VILNDIHDEIEVGKEGAKGGVGVTANNNLVRGGVKESLSR